MKQLTDISKMVASVAGGTQQYLPQRLSGRIFRRQWVNRRCSEFVIRSPTLRFLGLEGELGVTSVP
jgi:hypothetical protein